MMLKNIYNIYRSHGLDGVIYAARQYIVPKRAACLDMCRDLVRDRNGIEVGGPSGVFASRGVLPLYDDVKSLDNCNFSSITTWEGAIREGRTFHFSASRPPGVQYVAETTNLKLISDEAYDFLLSSHVIEHCANAIKVLNEWLRVVKVGGVLVLLFPHKDGTFDHRRPVTTLEHLVADFETDMQEDDLTHLQEILTLHDIWRDPGAGNPDEFRKRSEANFQNRCLHHHVFDTMLVARLLDYVGIELLNIEVIRPNHIVAVVRKPIGSQRANNGHVMAELPVRLQSSPFASDRSSLGGNATHGSFA